MLVTVVTPSFNGIEYLRDCIASTRSQEGPNVQVEHMIVDGGSTDGTVELARELGCTVMTGKDEGIFDAINKGSFAGRGELLGFLGCDDMLLPGALDAVVRSYREGGRRWVVGGIRWTDGDGVSRGDLAAPPSWMTVPMAASLGWNCIMHMASYVERDFYRELGGFDKRMKYSGDYDFFLRALAPRALRADRRDPRHLPPPRRQPEHVDHARPPGGDRAGGGGVRPRRGMEEAMEPLRHEVLAQRHQPLLVPLQAPRRPPRHEGEGRRRGLRTRPTGGRGFNSIQGTRFISSFPPLM
jgi:hypothetical protein